MRVLNVFCKLRSLVFLTSAQHPTASSGGTAIPIARTWLFAPIVALHCAAAGPPRGPEYVATNSEEAVTSCPAERKSAQEAREAVLGTRDIALRATAAKKVLAHARCEAMAALALPPPAGTQDQVLAGIRDIREQVRDASTLLAEVSRYGDLLRASEAQVEEAKLKLGFSELVGRVPVPADLEARGAAAFLSEMEEAQHALHMEAQTLLRRVLGSKTGAEVRRLACETLAKLDPNATGCP